MYCPKCQMIVKEGSDTKFCHWCGNVLIDEEGPDCPKCNDTLRVWDKFCKSCGAPIQEVTSSYLTQIVKDREEELKGDDSSNQKEQTKQTKQTKQDKEVEDEN